MLNYAELQCEKYWDMEHGKDIPMEEIDEYDLFALWTLNDYGREDECFHPNVLRYFNEWCYYHWEEIEDYVE